MTSDLFTDVTVPEGMVQRTWPKRASIGSKSGLLERGPVVEQELPARGAEETVVDPAGRTPLHYAALEDDVAEARRLLDDGEAPDAQDRQGFAPLHFACQQGNLAVARLLLGAGALVDVRDGYGNTPLWRAVFAFQGGDPELIRLLLDAGADPDARNNSDRSPRDIAMTFKRPGIETIFT